LMTIFKTQSKSLQKIIVTKIPNFKFKGIFYKKSLMDNKWSGLDFVIHLSGRISSFLLCFFLWKFSLLIISSIIRNKKQIFLRILQGGVCWEILGWNFSWKYRVAFPSVISKHTPP
jgi:hypothetical protein